MAELVVLLPDIVLLITIFVLVLGEVGQSNDKVRLISLTTFVGLLSGLVQTFLSYQYLSTRALSGFVQVDGVSVFLSVFFLTAGMLYVVSGALDRSSTVKLEANVSLLFCILFLRAGIATENLFFFFSSILMLALFQGVFHAHAQRRPFSEKVPFQWFAQMQFPFLVMGIGVLVWYSVLGSSGLDGLAKVPELSAPNVTRLLVGVLLIVLGFGAMVSLFPFVRGLTSYFSLLHSSSNVFSYLVNRAMFLGFVYRIMHALSPYPELAKPFGHAVLFLGLVSAAFAALLPVSQKGIKAAIASWVHVSFGLSLALMSLSHSVPGVLGQDVYWIGLWVECLSLFAITTILRDHLNQNQSLCFSEVANLSKPEGWLLIILFAVLSTLPPSPLFFLRVSLFQAFSADRNFLGLIVFAVITLIQFSEFVRVFVELSTSAAFQNTKLKTLNESKGAQVYALVLVAPIVAMFFVAEPMLRWIKASMHLILW